MTETGGYFALEQASQHASGLAWMDACCGYRSARSALAACVVALRPSKIWIPHFTCGAVADAAAGVPVQRYALTPNRGVPDALPIGPDELLLCVDYFGLSRAAVDEAVARYANTQLVVDAAQSLFLPPGRGHATIYSPRKFVGVPDGGLLAASFRVSAREPADETASIDRCQHLLYRLAGLTAAGYRRFQQAEASLQACLPQAMSTLTTNLLRGMDYDTIAQRRVANYRRLADLLNAAGFDCPALPEAAVPLCCPVACKNAVWVRKALAAQRIFTPAYWPDADIPDDDPTGRALRDETVYLPCDQRYGDQDMQRLAAAMTETGRPA